ncbi:MAG: hypothetical protein K6T91_02275 [Firmicutes bacterium]|nr:hypothetical protein [Bacillota bacterium]
MKIKAQKHKIMVLLVVALTLLTSCAKQLASNALQHRDVTSEAKKQDLELTKRSAGVTIYGRPIKIEIYCNHTQRLIKPGDKIYDKVCDAGERIILRVGSPASDSLLSEKDMAVIRDQAYAVVTFSYNKPPKFIFFKDLQNSVTFYIPANFLEMKPDTIYDGFYYGNRHMVSTLTNNELLEIVKDMD